MTAPLSPTTATKPQPNWIMVGIGLFLSVIFTLVTINDLYLFYYGVEAKAQVIEYYHEISSTSNTPDLYVRYSFFANPDPENPLLPGEMVFSREAARDRFYKKNPEGSEIVVLYDPQKPKNNRIKKESIFAFIGLNMFLIIFGVITSVIFFFPSILDTKRH